MENKLFTVIVWSILGLILFGLLSLFIAPIIWWTPESEARLYIRFFLLCMALITFGVLRIYNAIVGNTRFLIKLRETVGKLQREIPALYRSMRVVSQASLVLKDAIDRVEKALRKDEKEDK